MLRTSLYTLVLRCCAALLVLSACDGTVDAIAPEPATARGLASDVLRAFAVRFTNVVRDQRAERARARLGRFALAPSRVYHDSTLWSVLSPNDSSRIFLASASLRDGRYFFETVPSAPYPSTPGAQRHLVRLRWLGDGDYEWYTGVDHAIGSISPSAAGAALMAVLTAAEDVDGNVALERAAKLFPRAARTASRLFALNSLRSAPAPDGSSLVTLAFRLRPDSLRPGFSRLAAFTDRYVLPMALALEVHDGTGEVFLNMAVEDGRVLVRFRSRDRNLVSLGTAKPLPDTLRLSVNFSTRYRMFRIGFTGLRGELLVQRGEHIRGWLFRFRQEPAWHFPLAAHKLVRNQLRRPFQGQGVELLLAVRNDLGPQTMSVRYTRLVVNESAIMRWLGSLGGSVFAEFSGATEREAHTYARELFEAMIRDLEAWPARD
ncbi:MAG TPA: hypothetical protein VNL96_05585 [Gemmatimonadaceae bacterium]|nr:hypothetical protein [Gemmatimonadaceae bacterium]